MKHRTRSQKAENRGGGSRFLGPNWTLLGAACGLFLTAASAWAQNATIDWYRVANGGGVSSGNGCTIMGTIGQAEPGFVQAGNVALAEGFWSADAVVPPKVIYWNVASGNWSNPANWTPNVVPEPSDEVHIDNGGTVTVDANATAGTLSLGSGTLTGPGKLTLTGPLNWAQGTISGTVQCNGGTVGGGNSLYTYLTGGQLINTGHLTVRTLVQNGSFQTSSGSVISNLAGGTFDLVTDMGTIWNGSGARGTIYNAGLFRKSGGTGTSPIADTFNNLATGIVEGDSGILSLQYGGLNSGTNAASAGGTLDFGGGTHTLDANSWLAGGGVISCSGGAVNFSGASTLTGSLLVTGNSAGGTFNFNNVTPVSVGTVTMTQGASGGSGELGGSGTVAATGSLTWTCGTISGAVRCNGGTVGGASFQYTYLTGGQLINTGHLTVRTLVQNGSFQTSSGSVISNLAGGTFDLVTDMGTIWNGSGARGTIYNAGLFRKSGGTGTSSIADTFNNLATSIVECDSGILSLQYGGLNSGTNAASAAATLDFGGGAHTLDANSWLAGSGVISCSSGTVNFSGASVSTGTVLVDGGTFNFNNGTPASVSAVTITAGTLGGSGTLAASGPLNWTQGTISGTVQCNGGTVGGGNSLYTYLTGGQLINTGHLTVRTLVQNGSFQTSSGSVISNLAGGTFDLATDMGTIWNGNGARGTIYNAGLFRKSSGTGTSSIADTFNNLATSIVECDSGILSLQYGGLNSGTNAASAGGTLDFGGGTHTLDANSWLAGSGVISCSSGTVNFSGSSSVGGTLLIDGGTFNLNNTVPVTVGTFSETAGTLGGGGWAVSSGPMSWTGGTISAGVRANGGAIGGGYGSPMLLGGQLVNTGAMTNGTMGGGYYFYTGRGSVISNAVGATFDWVHDTGTVYYEGTVGLIYNAGVFRKSGGSGTSPFGDNFTNVGILEARSGTLDFTRAYVQTAGLTRLLEGRLEVDQGFELNGGRLEGTNTLTGNVLSSATVSPAGAASAGPLTINGNYTESGAAVLEIELGGAAPGAGFDELSVSGTVTLAGTLSVRLINSFVPPNNSIYNFLTAGSRTGAFSATNYPSSPLGVVVTYAANGASLIVTNTPSGSPVLTIRLIGGNSASLAWPSSPAGFHLEATSSLTPAAWAPVSQTPGDNGTNKTLVVPVSSPGAKFYRLRLSP